MDLDDGYPNLTRSIVAVGLATVGRTMAREDGAAWL
jgi:hypothetical protein